MTDYDLYVFAEIKYKREHPNVNEMLLFPLNWYSSRNYKLKVEIIVEALRKKIRVEETDLYQNKFIEGVKSKNTY